jgi:hypothetical protein
MKERWGRATQIDRWLTAAGYEPIEAYDEFVF